MPKITYTQDFDYQVNYINDRWVLVYYRLLDTVDRWNYSILTVDDFESRVASSMTMLKPQDLFEPKPSDTKVKIITWLGRKVEFFPALVNDQNLTNRMAGGINQPYWRPHKFGQDIPSGMNVIFINHENALWLDESGEPAQRKMRFIITPDKWDVPGALWHVLHHPDLYFDLNEPVNTTNFVCYVPIGKKDYVDMFHRGYNAKEIVMNKLASAWGLSQFKIPE